MPDWPSIVTSERNRRESQSARETGEIRLGRKALAIGLLLQATIATAGFGLIFWQSYLQWGMFPTATGAGGFLYFGVALAIALLWGLAIYFVFQMREPI